MHLHQASVSLDRIADYKKNTYILTEEVRAKVNQRWRFFFERCGYYPLLRRRPMRLRSFRQKNIPGKMCGNPPQFSRTQLIDPPIIQR
jgi:hypothetical protein